jgi:hypothetical protein
MTEIDGRIAGTLKAISPPWLRRTRGGAIVGAFADVLDELLDFTAEGVRARFPGDWTDPFPLPIPYLASDALPVIGRERRISRGPDERDDVYAARLRRWWTDHQKRGGAIAMLRQIEAFWSESPKRVSLRYASGTRWTLDPTVLDADGLATITRSTHPSNADLTRWARMTVVYELDADPGVLSADDVLAYTTIPREWTAGHVVLRVIVTWGGAVWGDGTEWGDGVTVWGEGASILYDEGV